MLALAFRGVHFFSHFAIANVIEFPETYLIKALVQPQSMLSLITKTTQGANVLSWAMFLDPCLDFDLARIGSVLTTFFICGLTQHGEASGPCWPF